MILGRRLLVVSGQWTPSRSASHAATRV